MLEIGVQSKNVINDRKPEEGFALLAQTGFSCVDFSLNGYLLNTDIYQSRINRFFDASVVELEDFFTAHKKAAYESGITINQMHMPYPIYIPTASREVNEYLWNQVAPKSMGICKFLECPYIVIHGLKMAKYLGCEGEEWKQTERFLDSIAPMATEMGITICIENLYENIGGHLVEGPCCDVKKAVERIDRMNDRYHTEVLGFCFDTGHANLVGIDFEEFITVLGSRLKVLHIHDNDGIADLHQVPFTFAKTRENKASTDWDGFIKGLRNIRFGGTLSFETAPVLTAFPDEMRQDVLGFIAQIGRYFAKEVQK